MPDQLTTTTAIRGRIDSPTDPLAALLIDVPDPAPTLLLVPGYTGSKEDFVPILDPLAAAGIRPIAIEMPGQHESSGPDDETAYSTAALGHVIAAAVRDLAAAHGPVVLLGHSYGGLVSRQVVLAGAPVAGLILLCSGPGALSSGRRFDDLVVGEPVVRDHGHAYLYDAQQRAAGLDPQRPDPLAQFLRTRFQASSAAGLLGMANALRTEPDLVGQLAAALADRHTPVAVIAGEHDDAWPITEQAQMAVRLGTRLQVIPGAGHSPAVETPQALVEILVPAVRDWSASAPAGGSRSGSD